MGQGKPATVDEYLAEIPNPAFCLELTRLRGLLKEELPEAEEVISYGIPTFKIGGPVLHYGAFASHCSLFLGAMTQEFEADLQGFKTSKGTIQFTPEKPIPEDLLRRMVRKRLEQHLALRAGRKSNRSRSTTS